MLQLSDGWPEESLSCVFWIPLVKEDLEQPTLFPWSY
jgi:hypothetical protein